MGDEGVTMFRRGHMEYRASGPLLQLYHVTYKVTLALDLAVDTMFVDLGHIIIIIIIIASSGLVTCSGFRDSHPSSHPYSIPPSLLRSSVPCRSP
jgi:hypothetical protein